MADAAAPASGRAGQVWRWSSRLGALVASSFGAAFCAFAAQTLLARHLAIAEYGFVVSLLALAGLLSPLVAFGLQWFWVQARGEEGPRGERWVAASFPLILATNLAALAVFAAYL